MPRPRLAHVTITRTYRADVDACADALADLALRLEAVLSGRPVELPFDPLARREVVPPGLAGS